MNTMHLPASVETFQTLTPKIKIRQHGMDRRAIMKNCKDEVVFEADLNDPASVEDLLNFSRRWLRREIYEAKHIHTEALTTTPKRCTCHCCECCK